MWKLFQKFRRSSLPPGAPVPGGPQWILLPLGNPGEEYKATRHNLGRLLLQRWMGRHCPSPGAVHSFQTGTLYCLGSPFLALVPGTYMNLSGQVVAEALKAGFDPSRMVVLLDDKDLPLGLGRFRPEGSAGGHNGLQSVIEHLGTERVARLRLGIGPFVRPLHQYVLGEWTEAERAHIEALDAPFARFMDLLAGCDDLTELAGRVNGAAFWGEGPALVPETPLEPQAQP